MKSKIFIGHVAHTRLLPKIHEFRYPVYVYGLHLDELEALDRTNPFFGYNRLGPARINDRDYLHHGGGGIRDKLFRHLNAQGVNRDIADVILVTAARYGNYAFNPVSFYFCYGPSEELVCAVVEVNNTYGERHLYTLAEPLPDGSPDHTVFSARKAFHVSPYNPVAGEYRFSFADVRKTLDIHIQLIRDGQPIFYARLNGRPYPLTPWMLLKTMLRYPLTPFLTVPRIFWEAGRLSFQRRLPFHDKPIPQSPMTIRTLPPTAFQRLCMKGVFRLFGGIRKGALMIGLPNGAHHTFGDDLPVMAKMEIRDFGFFTRVALVGGDIGLGESYMAGEWESQDLVAVFKVLIDNREHFADGHFATSLLSRIRERCENLGRKNDMAGSRRNIQEHYDVGNDFYRLFLDRSMTYSCAIFKSADESLEDAQRNKMQAVIEKARIKAEDHVLEIGCGWGSFALETARQTGCRVTGITVSKAQYDQAMARVREAGLADRVEILLKDYRQITGSFDKIVSIEMLEAVGHENFGLFFRRCEKLLRPHGLMVLQTITIPDFQYDHYRRERDWIQKHIFPGGLLPSLTVLSQAMSRNSRFVIEQAENIGFHYAKTLQEWRKRFVANMDGVSRLGFDRLFQRKWLYYLSICEAGFAKRVLGDLQLVLSRPGNPNL